ncbi:MAG TPA: hypothetical protein VGP90_10330, partial [Acidimicrobiia bacterium]|nr:hypothetical protein [Acidimicrobiia bacterium]
LYISLFGRVSALTFSSVNSLLYLAVLTVAAAVSTSVVSAFIAAALLVVVPSYLTSVTVDVQALLFGGTAVLATLVSDGQVDWSAMTARWRRRIDGATAASDARRQRGRLQSRPTASPTMAGVAETTGAAT